jgi:hypothetical protein
MLASSKIFLWGNQKIAWNDLCRILNWLIRSPDLSGCGELLEGKALRRAPQLLHIKNDLGYLLGISSKESLG